MNRAPSSTHTLASRIQAPRSTGCSRGAEASALPILRVVRAIAWALLVGALVAAATGDTFLAAIAAIGAGATWDVR